MPLRDRSGPSARELPWLVDLLTQQQIRALRKAQRTPSTMPTTLTGLKPSMPWVCYTSPLFSPSPLPLSAPSNGGHASPNSSSTRTPILSLTSFHPTQFASNTTSTLTTRNAHTTSMATATWAPPPLASQAENTTDEPSSNNWPTTRPSQQSCPYATGIPSTLLPNTPPFTLPPTQTTTRPGSANTCSSPNGNPP